ncbi:MAG: UDP-glucose 4-epimerase GalE [Melioribacteraceae bacterium]|nr:UDP-glucose 4-epimerase GalE [Melioribacteraceae bacterium]MCF8354173.1 UDP-glucose 4-epimerase GalE [Melioribacteraceae bacterium]MCF8394711.1 UDP-glucose 4-epimerase GalE [Melioribacteraceae bacterium]MCF8418096.1 UDP-glucose 4-epimerase GalE [Melioribacteraceae bacterium]
MILVSGGAGYIGSHFVKRLLQNRSDILVLDNLSRGHRESIPANVEFINADIRNYVELKDSLSNYKIDAVVHFAAFAYVGESVENPELYYENNVMGSFNLIRVVKDLGVKSFVFSSTCSLYGNPDNIPISENEKVKPINPYAQTKLTVENILSDFSISYGINYAALRYFNAAGADTSGEIGESHDPEPHLIPIVLQAALGKREKVFIFGDDYNTPDGTCIRDYIHVNDLADAHISALRYLEDEKKSLIVNLGTGEGYSVKEIIDTAAKITGRDIQSETTDRRPGDPAVLVADNKKALDILGWKPEHDLESIISSAWNWHKNQKY